MRPAEDAALLAALHGTWPKGKFDEASISIAVPGDARLLAALRPLGVRVTTVGPGGVVRLRSQDRPQIYRWLVGAAGRPAGGLVLRRDVFGWCSVEFAGGAAKPDPTIWARGKL
jgi:hypothetical protein